MGNKTSVKEDKRGKFWRIESSNGDGRSELNASVLMSQKKNKTQQ